MNKERQSNRETDSKEVGAKPWYLPQGRTQGPEGHPGEARVTPEGNRRCLRWGGTQLSLGTLCPVLRFFSLKELAVGEAVVREAL